LSRRTLLHVVTFLSRTGKIKVINLRNLGGHISAYGFADIRYQQALKYFMLGIFLFHTMPRTALRPPSLLCIECRGALSLEVELPGREFDHSLRSNAEVKE